ncbi:DUF1129 family protein [Lapidilactobacillus bayanensis]|uniref:DUF1129 family protein n=1 Tax=Lapidilactobacillus bayanensis TaxID=2485998 RepID=UPI000F7A17BA|nr:DUF1129 family protein [Lapidilactobacillus bayanensis]
MASTEERNQQARDEQTQKMTDKESSKEAANAQIEAMSPAELRAELTNKNNDYVFKLHKLLVEAGYTDADADAKLDSILPEIIKNQRIGKPANQIFGSPSFQVDQLLHPKKKPTELKYWMRSVDWTFLYLVILGVLFSVMGLIPNSNTKNNGSSGLLSLLIMSVAFGFLLTWFTDEMQAARDRRKNGEKSKMSWGVIGKGALATVGVLLLVSITAFINPALNPVLPGWGYLVLAALAYGARYLFRRYYHITGRLM